MATGYKVVTIVNSRAYSPATTSALQRVRYRVGKPTDQPEGAGPLAVFTDEQSARKFYTEYGDALFECEYEPSPERTLWKKAPPSFVRNRGGRGYHAESNGVLEKASSFPSGTDFASSVTLTRRIE